MVDYILTDGKGTAVRQSDSLQEGYVDVDLSEVAEVYTSLEDTDKVLVQRGVNDARTATVAVLKAARSDADWLNKGYLY